MRNIEVEVTLKGGQSHSCVLPSNSELLHDLYVSLAAAQQTGAQQTGSIMQLPLDDGKAACTFMSNTLVSVITRPAVLIQPADQGHPTASSPQLSGVPAHVQIDDFLTPGENAELLKYALENEDDFEGSTVLTDSKKHADDTTRKSRVLFAVKDSKWSSVFINRIKLHMAHIAPALGVADFKSDEEEIQLTASNDGDFFKRHADSDRNEAAVAGRTVTFVYYFHKLPKPYSGGDLLLYGSDVGQSAHDRGSFATALPPKNNCLVAFASHQWHEVDIVHCPSGEFADSRFTINGWLRRKSA
ncbi:MAG: 2OG-Fe(II) oxygenase [Alphaproteobacteria bacterium]|nr:2OG-Fe(II) oxygenase [Alphaproteobacteria bacterium]